MQLFERFLFTLILSLPLGLIAQISVDNRIIELGIVTKESHRTREIRFTNNTDKIQELVKVEADIREFDTRISSKSLAPGETVTLRIKFNPLNIGIKRIEIPVYFSKSDPVIIKFNADVIQLNWEDYTPCPDFDNPGQVDKTNFKVQFKVVDNLTGEPLHNAEVDLFEQGRKQATYKTNKKGLIEKEIPLAYYQMTAQAEGYSQNQRESYINKRNCFFIFALDNLNETPVTDNVKVPGDELEIILEEIQSTDSPETSGQSEFSINAYAANNVVFLIDVSTSMKKEGRLDLLKASMIQLLEMLRSEDRLCIVTYASSTDVVMNSRFVTNKSEISDIIQNLEGKGLTAGGQGIKKAYQIAQNNFIDNGNNQVYLATDGAFNKGENDVTKFVKKQTKKGIYMSILGIKSPTWAMEKMKEISNAAKGDYVSLNDESPDSAILNELIKKQSRIDTH